MRIKFRNHYILAAMMLFLTTTACNVNDVLTEEPRSLTPVYFQTALGLNSGITAAYATFRNYYATESGLNLTVYGTDEFTHGQQVPNPPLNTYG
jgi:starch-binding outer membrane protein, SusD/RagB family